jgi:predicted ATPase with chaperone activity
VAHLARRRCGRHRAGSAARWQLRKRVLRETTLLRYHTSNIVVLEALLLKTLYFRGDLVGRELANSLGLRFSIIEPFLEQLKPQRQLEVKSSLGMGSTSALFGLTEAGRSQARQYLEQNKYVGPAPVPLYQYAESVQAQCLEVGWVSREMLERAYRHIAVGQGVFRQLGPAVNTGRSLLNYGQPGNGKTYLAEALFQLDAAPIYLPYAIECQGLIIQLYDSLYHQRLDEDAQDSLSALAFAVERAYDGRWLRCRRPFLVTGGELALDGLDLKLNPNAKVYDAPFHLKANNGIYLIDDFGRQKATPAEVLNRWIIPLEK